MSLLFQLKGGLSGKSVGTGSGEKTVGVIDKISFRSAGQIGVQHLGLSKAQRDVLNEVGVHANPDLRAIGSSKLFGECFVHLVLKLF